MRSALSRALVTQPVVSERQETHLQAKVHHNSNYRRTKIRLLNEMEHMLRVASEHALVPPVALAADQAQT